MGTTLSREDLAGMVDRYLDALTGRAANRLPLSGRVRYTENGVQLALDDGLWGVASRAGRYRILVPDVEGQQIGWMGVIEEAGQLACVTTRLRFEDGYITEIETLAAHPSFMGGGAFGGGAAELEKLGTPHPAFLEALTPAEKLSRVKLIEISNSYFSGLERNTGRYPVPFDPECERRENGMRTTHNPDFGFGGGGERAGGESDSPNMMLMSPAEQFASGGLAFVTAIRNRRFPCVDEETGNVLAFGYFDHDGQAETVTWADGKTRPSPVRIPMTFQIAELFKVKGGKLRQIEAHLTSVPYRMKCACWDE
jgi:hypothetical protein